MTTETESLDQELSSRLGTTALLKVHPTMRGAGQAKRNEPLWVPVRITGGEVKFGRLYYQVTPVDGEGSQWVTPDRLRDCDT